MKRLLIMLFIGSSVLSNAGAAFSQSAPMVISRSPSADLVLAQGTPIRLRTVTGLGSQESSVGQRFDLEVAQDVLLNGIVVIPRGSPAQGEVTAVHKKGMWGQSGKLSTRLIFVRSFGRDIPIRGTIGNKGEAGTGGVVAALVVLPVAGFFVTGTSAAIAPGTDFTGVIDADIPIALEKPSNQ